MKDSEKLNYFVHSPVIDFQKSIDIRVAHSEQQEFVFELF